MWRQVVEFAKANSSILKWWAEIILVVMAALGWAIALIYLVEQKWGG